jgi:hypothetical protein
MVMGFQRVGITGKDEEVGDITFELIPEKAKMRKKPKRKYTKRSPYWEQRRKTPAPQLARSKT